MGPATSSMRCGIVAMGPASSSMASRSSFATRAPFPARASSSCQQPHRHSPPPSLVTPPQKQHFLTPYLASPAHSFRGLRVLRDPWRWESKREEREERGGEEGEGGGGREGRRGEGGGGT
eukprot:3765408-Rhodomonas_salina.1